MAFLIFEISSPEKNFFSSPNFKFVPTLSMIYKIVSMTEESSRQNNMETIKKKWTKKQ